MAPINPWIKTRCANCTCMSVAFHQLTEDELLRVDEHRTELVYRKGEILCKQGAFMSNMMFLRKGLVKLYLEGPVGGESIISMETNGHFIGLTSIFKEQDPIYGYTVEALVDTEVCLVDLKTFESLITENSSFAKKIIEMQNRQLMKHHKHLFSLSQKQIRGRFSEFLLDITNRIYRSDRVYLTISRKDMAEYISTSQESISRLLSEFRSDGLIRLSNNDLEILDRNRLEKISLFG